MRKLLTGFGIAVTALIAGGMAGSIATNTAKTVSESTTSVQSNNNVQRTQNQDVNRVNVIQSQPVIDRRKLGSSGNTVRRKPYPSSIPQKYKKHTNRLRCKHNSKLRKRRSA